MLFEEVGVLRLDLGLKAVKYNFLTESKDRVHWLLDINVQWTARGHHGTNERERTPDLSSTDRINMQQL